MKKLSFLSGLLVLLVLASCKKDHDNGEGNATRQLQKVTKTMSGQTLVYTFSYDSQHRLTNVKTTDNSENTSFYYDAAGNLAKIESVEDNYKTVFIYTYQNNLPKTGTQKVWQLVAGEPDALVEDDVLTYTVENGNVTKIKQQLLLDEEELTVSLTYANNNMVKLEAVDGDIYYAATFTYGTHQPIFPAVSPYVLDIAGFSLQYAAHHELLSVQFDFPGDELDYTMQTQYTYDSKGYVLTADDGETKMTFEYQ